MFVQLVTVLALVSGALSTTVEKCENGSPLPTEVRIKDCKAPPCDLVRGTDIILDIDFKTPADTATLVPQVKANVLGISVDFPLPQDQVDACKHLVDGYCPIDKDEELTYHLVMPVLPIYPKVKLALTYSLVDDSKKEIACFKVPCVVVDKN